MDNGEENASVWNWGNAAIFFFYLALFLSPWLIFTLLGELVARTILLACVIIYFTCLAATRHRQLRRK